MKKKFISVILLITMLFSFITPAFADMEDLLEDTVEIVPESEIMLFTTGDGYLGSYELNKATYIRKESYVNNVIPFYESVKTYHDASYATADFTTWFDVDSLEDALALAPSEEVESFYDMYKHVIALPCLSKSSMIVLFYDTADIVMDTYVCPGTTKRYCSVEIEIGEGAYQIAYLKENTSGIYEWSIYRAGYTLTPKTVLTNNVLYGYTMGGLSTSKVYNPTYWERSIFNPYMIYYYYFSDTNIFNSYGELMIQANSSSGGSLADVSTDIEDIKNSLFDNLANHPFLSRLLELLGLADDDFATDEFGGGDTRGGGAGRENIVDIDVETNNTDKVVVNTTTETIVDEETGETIEVTVIDDTSTVNVLKAIYNKLSDIYYFLVNVDFASYFSNVPASDDDGTSLSLLDYVKLAIVGMTDILGSLLQGVIDAVGVLGSGIIDALAQVPVMIFDLMRSLLVPTDDDMQELWTSLNDTMTSKFGDMSLDLSPILGNETAPTDIIAVSTYGESKIPATVSFVNWTWFGQAVEYFRPYIQAVLIVMLMLFHFNQVLHFMGVAPISNSGRQSSGRKDG